MANNEYEYSFRTASQCIDSKNDRLYLDWFLKRSEVRVNQAAIGLNRLVDGCCEFDSSTIGTVRSHLATVLLIEQGLADLRDHSAWSDKVEQIHDTMGVIAANADSVKDNYQVLSKVFSSVL